MKVYVSLVPRSMDEALSMLRVHGKRVDLVELRVDGIDDLHLAKLLKQPRPKLIITNRRESEGGSFTGSKAEQFEILSTAMKLGVEYIDVEYSWGKSFVRELLKHRGSTKIIVSYHDFFQTPSSLRDKYQLMVNTGGDIVKIVTMASDITDNKEIFDLIKEAKSKKQKLIAHCMGEKGQISRILSEKYDGFLTYAAPDTDRTTAPGQLTLSDLQKIYRVHTLNSSTKIFGLVGNPVAQSKGIYYHNRIFKRRDINAVYVNFLVDDLPSFISTFKSEVTGLSITMPFKHSIVPMLDSVEDEAASLGLVNTVLRKNNKLIGMNTDLPAIESILSRKVKPRGKHVLVLGTGATAKTMAYVALKLGAAVTIIGRSFEKTKTLAKEVGCHCATLDELRNIKADIIINATPVGMENQQNIQLVPKKYLRSQMIVFDAVYNPPMTPLLLNAQAQGCKIISGLEFFQLQAHHQSKLFLQVC